jgi:type IV secretory pathway TrbD component
MAAKVYQSLVRPKLRRGCEWRPALINGCLALYLVWLAFMYREWWVVGAALVQYPLGQWLLRQAAKHDAQWFPIYARAWGQPLIRMPQPRADAKERKPKPLLPPVSHWTK